MAATKLASKTRIYLDVKQMLDIALHHIAQAYMLSDLQVRIEHLSQLQTELEVVSTLIDIAGEHRWIMGINKLATLLRLREGVGRQCTAWKGSLLKALASERECSRLTAQ